MSNLRRVNAEALLIDGTHLGPSRQIMADRIRWETAARANRWTLEDNAFTFSAFSAWAVFHRTGEFTGTYDEFVEQLETVDLSDPDDTETAEDVAPDPTPRRAARPAI